MLRKIRKFLKNTKGASLIEYALLVGGWVGIVILVGMKSMGNKIKTQLTNISDSVG